MPATSGERTATDPAVSVDYAILVDVELLPGVDATAVRDNLSQLRDELGNAVIGVSTAESLMAAVKNYLQKVELVESTMQHYFVGDAWLDQLHSPRYWHIRELRADSLRPWPLLTMEVKRQQARLERVIGELDALIEEDARADPVAARAVIDTNVHLHFKPFTDIGWCDILEQEKVRILVLVAVLRELDGKKNAAKKPTGDRAAARLKTMRRLLAGHGAGPVEVGHGVTLEVLLDRRGHRPQFNTDEEILDRTEELVARKGGPVRLVTGDLSMQLRAEARGLTAVALPDELRLEPPPGTEAPDPRRLS